MPLNKIYTVNWDKLTNWLVPYDLLLDKVLAFAKALIYPVQSLHSSFMLYASYVDYWLGINSQVCYMEKALNDRYDKTVRGIYIADAIEKNALPLFLKVENKPLVLNTKEELPPLVLYTKAETAEFTVDFVVFVPGTVVFDLTEITVFVNSIKLPTKTFQIKVI